MTALRDDFRLYIDGAFVTGGASFESYDPATGQPWAVMPAATTADVNRAVEAAHRAFDAPEWANLTATQRGKLLMRLGDLVATHAQELAELETRDTGKIIRETRAQIGYVAEYYRFFGGLADKVEGSHLPVDKPDMEAWLRREPIGVVAAVVPWNSQLFLSAVKLGPALAAGCTIVLKASEEGPAPLLAFAKLVHEAGFPPGVVNIITGFGEECGRTLTAHRLVSRVAFTGGPATARHVVRNTAENLAYTTLELGGKSPVLVFADADLESAANAVVAGIFAASGQSCVAGSRLFVEESVRDKLLAILTAKARRIRIGDPQDPATEMGPLATARQLGHIEQVVAASLAAGATLVTGGQRAEGLASGNYYAPTILACAGNEVPCAAEELFGPVLSVIGFDGEADAITKANDSPFGLAAGVFTRDLTRAHRLIRKLRAGIVWVNTYRAVSPIVPFGGYGLSGLGREGGAESIRDYTRTKSVWLRTSDAPIDDPFVMR
ncbi:aldehyde dehydrogenase [Ancylobacter polymorphus]|uniref:Aldehyde dehydrogenase (NAD+)/betaine-aldehyde dehydrogenase n=1 Tax=Ancylobacter polymorphus TaxID=223390 RepID=A0ABU0B6L7_9HYPH|nr:aldehyde dehydrogenase [Ancylobacter polymorphus]MDQ0301471.1 aldehyde dehydrogenase (NAD+)/betaine-aldehyde dehydrogenase [Ancylobacter polymorphus]